MFKKAMIYLGLGPDEAYDDYPASGPGPAVDPGAGLAAPQPHGAVAAQSPVHRQQMRPPQPAFEPPRTVRALPPEPANPDGGDGPAKAVRTLGPAPPKPYAISPTAFNDAQAVGDRLKAGQSVIMNLQDVERDLRRRLVDFASGLCYALGGKMDRVAKQVYLLNPENVEGSDDKVRSSAD